MDFLNSDIPDPTDFPIHAIAPGLRSLDGSFRCDICGDLYDAPVTIACGHCFCSMCIRTSLSNKQECPSCRKSATEAQLRPNPTLDKVISDWKEARPFILFLLKRQNERMASEEDRVTSKKRKRTPSRASSPSSIVSGPSCHPSSPNSNSTTLHSKEKKRKYNKRDVDITIPSSDAEENDVSVPHTLNLVPNVNDFVNCPICETRVKYRKLNEHIDNQCNDQPTQSAAKTWSKILAGGQNKGKHKKKDDDSDEEHPLPIQTYATLKDKQLKEMLQEYQLPVTGSRSNWEQRHQRWVMLYNSNLDRSFANRKTKAELRKDLRKWEEERSKRKKIVINDLQDFQIQHKNELAKLVEAARHNRTPQQTPAGLVEGNIPTSAALIAPTTDNNVLQAHLTTTEGHDEIVIDSEDAV